MLKTTNDGWYTEHFNSKEFECGCGCGLCCPSMALILKLETARTIANIPFIINSGSRCETYNLEVGGSVNSSHLPLIEIYYDEESNIENRIELSYAADIKADTTHKRTLILPALYKAGFERIGLNAINGFIHADIDPNKHPAFWTYIFRDGEIVAV